MTPYSKYIQPELTLNGANENRAKERSDSKVFQAFLEMNAPSPDTALSDVKKLYYDYEYEALSRTGISAALAFTDKEKSAGRMGTLDFARELCLDSRDSHLFYVSGYNRNIGDCFSVVRQAQQEGFKNFCLVSGLPREEINGKIKHREHFTESVYMLKSFSKSVSGNAVFGCVHNPFRYLPWSAYAASFKLIKKAFSGAGFVVSQFGWDLKKIQEMRWYMFSRFMDLPSVARICYFSRDEAAGLLSDGIRGISLSPDIRALLKYEQNVSEKKFHDVQMYRVLLNAAGAKFLGFKGVQISGATAPGLQKSLLDTVERAQTEFHSFQEWLCACRDYYGRLETAPYPHRFYIFQNLLEKDSADAEPVYCGANRDFCKGKEIFQYHLARFFCAHANELPSTERLMTKRLLVSCRTCAKCRLNDTMYVCPELCPKGLANGMCGETEPSGECPYQTKGKECVFHKRYRLSQTFNEYSNLEETVIPSPESRI